MQIEYVPLMPLIYLTKQAILTDLIYCIREQTTERFEKLQELCIAYDCLSGPERQESLIEFLGKFSNTDNIPKFSKGDIEDGSDIASSSDSESE